MVSSFLVKIMWREKADTSPEGERTKRDGQYERRGTSD